MSELEIEHPPRRRVVITGAGVLSPLGRGREALAEGLLAGASGIGPITGFDPGALPVRRAGELGGGGPEGKGPEPLLEGRSLRPLDRTGRLAAAAAELALADSGYRDHHRRLRAEGLEAGDAEEGEGGEKLKESFDAGLVLGTMYGSVRTISEFDRRALTAGPNYTKPFDFANSVINAAAGQAAIWHGLGGVNATIAGAATAGLAALAHGADLIRGGRAEALLAGGAEELCFESSWAFHQAGLSAPREDAVTAPYDARREGFLPGEGSALLMLEEAGAARRREASVLAVLAGSGSSFDPSRGQDPESLALALERAIRAALEDAGVGPEDLDALSTSASGGPLTDRAEARGIGQALGETARRLPVAAVKGALGEGLGVSGAFAALALVEAFHRGALPGILGLEEPEEDLPLALGPAAGAAPQEGTFRRGLVTAVGWDGNAWALVLEAPSPDDPSNGETP